MNKRFYAKIPALNCPALGIPVGWAFGGENTGETKQKEVHNVVHGVSR